MPGGLFEVGLPEWKHRETERKAQAMWRVCSIFTREKGPVLLVHAGQRGALLSCSV